eukprot:4766923-Amphidinium_carterae.1
MNRIKLFLCPTPRPRHFNGKTLTVAPPKRLDWKTKLGRSQRSRRVVATIIRITAAPHDEVEAKAAMITIVMRLDPLGQTLRHDQSAR